jgi:hypothetical protein
MTEEGNTTTTTEEKGGSAGRTAAKAAVAAAATGAAAVAVKKMLDSRSNGSNGSENGGGSGSKRSGDSKALMTSIASGSWDAAQDALVPLAGDVAAAAGKYVAQNGPDIVKDQIVPRFIDAFNEAK